MALPDFRGKTKKDLSAIAHISGLLTASDTSRMTKQQLIDFLTRMAEESELTVVEDAGPAEAEKAGEEIARTEPAPATSELRAGDLKSGPAPKKTPARKSTKVTPKKKTALPPRAEGEDSVPSDALHLEEMAMNGEGTPEEGGPEKQAEQQELMTGVLEIMPEGYGFLRIENYIQS
ncbi:MAG: hypothetical protein GX838_00285, partial [Clostridiaceae bacterium]|nr:hypothetical protein [Clostridiaceae bacterium]